jgi:IS5 family transposase
MQRQGSFSQAEYASKKKQTRRDKFLAEMELVVPWARLVERLRPFYPKGERGRPPSGLERMLRVYVIQQWYGLADEALEDALYDTQALRGSVGIDLNRHPVPDATTVTGLPPLAGAARAEPGCCSTRSGRCWRSAAC